MILNYSDTIEFIGGAFSGQTGKFLYENAYAYVILIDNGINYTAVIVNKFNHQKYIKF